MNPVDSHFQSGLGPFQFSVAPGGDDRGPGTVESPFATLERARDAVRASRASQGPDFPGAVITLHGGLHVRSMSFELGPEDSGTTAAPVVYAAADGETPRLVGGRRVDGFTPVRDPSVRARLPAAARDRVVSLHLPDCGIVDFGVLRPRGFHRPYVNAALEVFVNRRPLRLSRWPKDSVIPITTILDSGSRVRNGECGNKGGLFKCDAQRPLEWPAGRDLWVQGMFGTVWADDMIRVAEFDRLEQTLRLADAHAYGVEIRGKAGAYYQFVNVLDELAQPGEYYMDHDTGMLYLYPPEPIDDAEVLVSLLEEPLVVLENASHIEFRGIAFETSRGMGVYLERGCGTRFTRCEFRNLGTVAVCMGQGVEGPEGPTFAFTGTPVSRRLGNLGSHLYANPHWNRQAGCGHEVVDCLIEDTGAGGVILSGGDRQSLSPAGNRVAGCCIRRTNRLSRTYCPGVWIDGVGNVVENSTFEDLSHSAIIFEGNDHRIEGNRIHNVVNDSEDGGAIYAGRDIAMHGNTICRNVISGVRGGVFGFRSGIYLDDHVGGIDVIGNVLHGNSIAAVVSGRFIRVLDNVAIGNDRPISLDGRLPCDRHLEVLRSLRCDREPWLSRYPQVNRALDEHWGKPVGMEARNNVCIGGPVLSFDMDIDMSFITLDNNLEW